MPPRNILVLLCDQLRPDFLSLYGCTAIPTPNLDRLARRGVVFDHAITQSTVCAPARASMMTGRYASDHHVWTNDVPFRDGLDYLPGRMNALGYRTACAGKLHHWPADDTKGFGQSWQMEEGRLGEQDDYYRYLKSRHRELGSIWAVEDGRFAFDDEDYYEHWIADRTMAFIESVPRDEPFFMWTSFQGPHGPLDVPRSVAGTCRAEDMPEPILSERDSDVPVHRTRRIIYDGTVYGGAADFSDIAHIRAAYGDLVVFIDRQVGRILDHLEACGRLEDTTIVFSSDHGDLLGDFGQITKGPFAWHGQLAIPLLVANHPGVQPGTRCDALVGNIDIPGTVLAAAGDATGIGYARDLVEMTRRDSPLRREVNYSEHADCVKIVDCPPWRYAWYPFTGARELYHRGDDPHERVNLAGRPDCQEVERRMMEHIAEFLIVAKTPEVPAYDFTPQQQAGLAKKHPYYRRDGELPVAIPLTDGMREKLRRENHPEDYDRFVER